MINAGTVWRTARGAGGGFRLIADLSLDLLGTGLLLDPVRVTEALDDLKRDLLVDGLAVVVVTVDAEFPLARRFRLPLV